MHHLIEGAKQGDRTSYEQIVQKYTGMAFAVAYEKLHDFYLAEDAIQESFAEAFINLSKLQESEAFPGWFKTIVERQCHRLLRRKQHRMISIHEIENVAGEENLAFIVERGEMQQKLHAIIADLSPNLRLAIQLFYFHGYTIREISSILDTSVSVVKKRLFDARHKLKRSFPVADFISVFNDLYEGGAGVLHIVNGDAVADKLKQGGIQGDILVWRELYSFGPVFSDMTGRDNRAIRAQYLESTLGIPQTEYIQNCEKQEKTLQEFKKYKEVVLWFEHDLFDQTMLCYLLNWFEQQSLSETRLSLLCIGEYPGVELFRGLGQLTPKQLKKLYGTWQSIGRGELELGSKMWGAYTSQELGKHLEVLQEDTSALPFVKDAFEAHLSRLPSTYNGLGIIEQTTLEFVAGGISAPYKLCGQVVYKLNALGMGDLEYWYHLEKMSEEPYSLLHIQGGKDFPKFKNSVPLFRECVITLTELGRKVLAGEIDWAAVKDDDEWFGGFRLQGSSCRWRWDASRNIILQR